MIEFTATHFDELCRSAPVSEQLTSLEARRHAALKRFWMFLIGGLALAAAAVWTLFESGWPTMAVITGVCLAIFAIILAASPLMKVSQDLKGPVLGGLADRAGMEYMASGFDPPAFGAARLLFGGATSQSFTDLFHGKDSEGHGYAVYEACLQRRAGKNNVTIFQGQLYGIQRRAGRSSGITVILPDRKLFNFFKPARDMERVRIESDEAFEKKFEVYSTQPLEAKQLLFDSDLRRRLLQLREQGRVYVALNGEEALVGLWGKDRFEPGSMFRSRDGQDRVRLMFDDVCASLAILKDLKARLG